MTELESDVFFGKSLAAKLEIASLVIVDAMVLELLSLDTLKLNGGER
jgi:hypothetical protein